MEKRILEKERELLRWDVSMRKIEENVENEEIEESCGMFWRYIVHQTFQITLVVHLEVQASRVYSIQQHMNTRTWTRIPSF